MLRKMLCTGVAGISLATGALVGLSASAGATTGPSGATGITAKNAITQQQLESELANRSTQLQHLVSDVAGAHSLTASHAATLNARLLTEQASISALIAKVPSDTTTAELRSDRQAMLRDNRVYVVMTPQVFEIINADVVVAQLNTLTAEEPALLSEVNSISGEPGFRNAQNHYNNFVKRMANQSARIANVETTVLAQTPTGYPKNTKVFVSANHSILDANVAIAYANYDASVIALATGGYTGS